MWPLNLRWFSYQTWYSEDPFSLSLESKTEEDIRAIDLLQQLCSHFLVAVIQQRNKDQFSAVIIVDLAVMK